MSKKITHKEVEKAIDKYTWLTGKLADWSGNDWSDLEEDFDFITNENIIINYIKQQEEVIKKQQKLLKLYKEYYELDRMYVKNNFFLELENLNRRSEIVEQIKVLEKEEENE